MNNFVNKLKEGKKAMAEKCQAIADKYTPEGVTVEYINGLRGSADYITKVLKSPKPVTRKALYIYLHECGHFNLGHEVKGRKPRYIEEYEAEQYAIGIMRKEGIKLSRQSLQRAKRHVAKKIRQAQKRGLKKVNKKIEAWSQS